MSMSLEIAVTEVEASARAARDAIDARLARLPEDQRPDFWRIVSIIYARGIAYAEPAAPAPAPTPAPIVELAA
ncbi:hypothetical protein [Methylobacterium soli]|jgi:hypothetical protein|uniref:Uncharacterized protein n=1 Tax=Methylobacterium soli TaxID=553447 RepID=A0A6L3SR30_9HYPH|nr:hypothetical protein [Methylobacterium soli]KAB1074189.1 hypothetical protein F6X53_26230 [Methylobacterium soli]GJE44950.1 hypothetical protein AEGHOMDF_4144 [Methylobacterium soli]